MKDKIEINLILSRRQLLAGLASLLVIGLSIGLTAENVTLSTYYPAPSGVYAKLITTQDTVLARDSASVTMGPGTPAAGTKLAVMNGSVGIGTLQPTSYGTAPPRAAVLDVNGFAAANDLWIKTANRWASDQINPVITEVTAMGAIMAIATCPAGFLRLACGGSRDKTSSIIAARKIAAW